MPDLLSFEFNEFLTTPAGKIATWVLALLVGLGILRKLWKWLHPPRSGDSPDSALIIQLELPTEILGTRPVHVRNLPCRMAAVVVAPLGGSSQVPSIGQVPGLVDKLVPNLSKAIEEHGPIVKVWPRQFSSSGFGHALLRYVRIPDNEWRGSRWCAICGPAFLQQQRCIMGLVIAFDSTSNMELITLENDGEWPEVVHVAGS